jgi:hypothetical protein
MMTMATAMRRLRRSQNGLARGRYLTSRCVILSLAANIPTTNSMRETNAAKNAATWKTMFSLRIRFERGVSSRYGCSQILRLAPSTAAMK